MQVNSTSTLTILHDGQFWVAVCEHAEAGLYGARRVVFGPHEPTDELVLEFVCARWAKLDFRLTVDDGIARASAETTRINPKRQQRLVRRAVAQAGAGTKAQQAIREGYEASKAERSDEAKDRRQAAKERQFELKQQKRKEKRRGH